MGIYLQFLNGITFINSISILLAPLLELPSEKQFSNLWFRLAGSLKTNTFFFLSFSSNKFEVTEIFSFEF